MPMDAIWLSAAHAARGKPPWRASTTTAVVNTGSQRRDRGVDRSPEIGTLQRQVSTFGLKSGKTEDEWRLALPDDT